MTELPELNECRYCGHKILRLEHYQYEVDKGINDIQDIRCVKCKGIQFGISKFIKD